MLQFLSATLEQSKHLQSGSSEKIHEQTGKSAFLVLTLTHIYYNPNCTTKPYSASNTEEPQLLRHTPNRYQWAFLQAVMTPHLKQNCLTEYTNAT